MTNDLKKTTTQLGQIAESLASDYLQTLGYQIIDRNFRSRWCEIDVIAKNNNKVYFVEVKYRKNDFYGDGLDAITSKKLRQMSFAADYWINQKKWIVDYQLAVISVSKSNFKICDFIVI